MLAMVCTRGLNDRSRSRGRQLENGFQRMPAQMRLVPEHNHPMRQSTLPSCPSRGALDGAEHSQFRNRVFDSVLERKLKPLQLAIDNRIVNRANDGDLVCA